MTYLVKMAIGDIRSIEAAVRLLLNQRGFGVITEIDISELLNDTPDLERPSFKILGAFNPLFVKLALEIDRSAALFMPCRILLEQCETGVRVSAMDPFSIMDMVGMKPLADEAMMLLNEVLEQL